MRILLALFIQLFLCNLLFSQASTCSPPKESEYTHWAGNLEMVSIEQYPFGVLRGVIKTPQDSPLKNALVEGFTKPDYLLTKKPVDKRGRPEQKRIAACRTGADGRFSFPYLPAGKYELRSSSEDSRTGWNVSQVYVVINPKYSKRRELRVEMSLGI